jgi:hypothetical protein
MIDRTEEESGESHRLAQDISNPADQQRSFCRMERSRCVSLRNLPIASYRQMFGAGEAANP